MRLYLSMIVRDNIYKNTTEKTNTTSQRIYKQDLILRMHVAFKPKSIFNFIVQSRKSIPQCENLHVMFATKYNITSFMLTEMGILSPYLKSVDLYADFKNIVNNYEINNHDDLQFEYLNIVKQYENERFQHFKNIDYRINNFICMSSDEKDLFYHGFCRNYYKLKEELSKDIIKYKI
jgi:hypothetical protein